MKLNMLMKIWSRYDTERYVDKWLQRRSTKWCLHSSQEIVCWTPVWCFPSRWLLQKKENRDPVPLQSDPSQVSVNTRVQFWWIEVHFSRLFLLRILPLLTCLAGSVHLLQQKQIVTVHHSYADPLGRTLSVSAVVLHLLASTRVNSSVDGSWSLFNFAMTHPSRSMLLKIQSHTRLELLCVLPSISRKKISTDQWLPWLRLSSLGLWPICSKV